VLLNIAILPFIRVAGCVESVGEKMNIVYECKNLKETNTWKTKR